MNIYIIFNISIFHRIQLNSNYYSPEQKDEGPLFYFVAFIFHIKHMFQGTIKCNITNEYMAATEHLLPVSGYLLTLLVRTLRSSCRTLVSGDRYM